MYCPFAAEYRKKLESQPIFNAASARFNRENTKKVRELKTFNSNVLKRGGQVTEVLQKNLDFYELGSEEGEDKWLVSYLVNIW